MRGNIRNLSETGFSASSRDGPGDAGFLFLLGTQTAEHRLVRVDVSS